MDNLPILVIDDDPRIADTLESILVYEGFPVIWASTGAEGLRLALTEGFCCILLDIHLPDMRGYDICRQLRNAGKYVLIILMSVENQEEDIVRGLKSGANDYLAKPFGLDELISRIHTHLHWQRVYQNMATQASSPTEEPLAPVDLKPHWKRPQAKKEPEQRTKSAEMPLLTRLAIRNGNNERKNTATLRIEALDRARINRWNEELSEKLDERTDDPS
jgi:DNA-binding response OmpR family regulator